MLRNFRASFLALGGLSAALLGSCATAHAQLVATYQFNNTLGAVQNGAPALTPVNSGAFTTDSVFGQTRTLYSRTSASTSTQSALRLDTTPLNLSAKNYAVEVVFNFTDSFDPRGSSGYRRIVDSFDPGSLQDPGFYVGPGNTLNIYNSGPNGGGPALTDGTYYDVVLSVSPTGEQAYLNGTQVVNYNGTPDAIASHFLTFFQDDGVEYGNGKIALLKVFNRALSSGEVTTLNNNGNPFGATAAAPEPASLAYVLPALAGMGMVFTRRRGFHG